MNKILEFKINWFGKYSFSNQLSIIITQKATFISHLCQFISQWQILLLLLGHEFHRNYFTQPTNCSVCDKFLWGVGQKQGFLCIHCRMSVHTDCVEKVFTKCLKGKMCEQDKSKTPLMNINIPHKWETKTFTRPTMCKHCGQLIFGFYKQGVYCKACKMAAHKKCMDQIGTDYYRMIPNDTVLS